VRSRRWPAKLEPHELEPEGPFRLAALHTITTLTGSAILALALEGASSADEAWAAAHVDEDWQIEQWGADAEAQARRAARRAEFDCAVRLLDFV
jgi:chaperone required for assembly of F1-ATPase